MRLILILLLSLPASVASAGDHPHRVITEGGVQRIAFESQSRYSHAGGLSASVRPLTFEAARQPTDVHQRPRGRVSHLQTAHYVPRDMGTRSPVVAITNNVMGVAVETTERQLNREINSAIRQSIRRNIQF